MQVRSTTKLRIGERLRDPLCILKFFFLGNLLLTDIWRVADDGIERRQHYRHMLVLNAIWQLTECPAYYYIEEVGTRDARVVGFIVDLTGGKVQRCQMGGIQTDVSTV